MPLQIGQGPPPRYELFALASKACLSALLARKTHIHQESEMQLTDDRFFEYHDCEFVISVEHTDRDLFLPHVRYLLGLPNLNQLALPVGVNPYASAEEARRHGEQQAVRWVHDRTGDGQGRF